LIVINIGCSGSGASNDKTKRKRKCDEAATTELGKKKKKLKPTETKSQCALHQAKSMCNRCVIT
jgi:hypothetical protein